MRSRLDRTRYEVELDDRFEGSTLDPRLWIPHYLPHWSSQARSAARYAVGGGALRLRIEADQAPWNPEMDGQVRVSSLQTGLFAGPAGSTIGQHHFRDGLVVREAQPRLALYTPQYGLVELEARAPHDADVMVALWMIGFEDAPERSAEICVCEIFGRDVRPGQALAGMGVHPFADPAIRDEFAAESIHVDVREPHRYAAEWTPDQVAFYVDEEQIKVVRQSPAYPMQLMLNIYELLDDARASRPSERYPKEFVVTRVRGSRPTTGPGARPPAFPSGDAWPSR